MPEDQMPMKDMANGAEVLLVEEHHLLRVGMALALSQNGFRVRECAAPEVALPLLQRHEDIRLVVTEVVFQGRPVGLDLSVKARARFPEIAVILLTASPEMLAGVVPSERERHLVKPVSIDRLTSLARDMILSE